MDSATTFGDELFRLLVPIRVESFYQAFFGLVG